MLHASSWLSSGLAAWVLAQAMLLPAAQQGPLLARIMSYDSVIAAKNAPLHVLVMHSGVPDADTKAIVETLASNGIESTLVTVAQVQANASKAMAVYVPPGVANADIAKLCAQNKLLSMTSSVSLVESGLVAIGLGRRIDGRPEIVVNLTRLEAEGHRFEARFMRLVRVVQ